MNDEARWPGPTQDWDVEKGFPTHPVEGHFYETITTGLLYQFVRGEYNPIVCHDYCKWRDEDHAGR